MTKEQTTWEEEFELLKLNDTWYCGGNQDNVEILREETKQFISKTISQEREKCIKEEVFAFMHHLQEKANTVSPNLLLNEVVNYAYDRINLLKNK